MPGRPHTPVATAPIRLYERGRVVKWVGVGWLGSSGGVVVVSGADVSIAPAAWGFG
jgi:hypothetical protein